MPRHLKTRIMNRMDIIISHYEHFPSNTAPRARGVRYFVPVELFKAYWGAMNTVEEGQHYRKHIVVRRMPYAKGLLQLYTYHFPTHWSAACVANRELIKQAQRYAHALEHDHSYTALEWRMRFFRHYYRVVKGGHAPEPGLKAYSRFYQYAYVCIYRDLKAEQQARLHSEAPSRLQSAQSASQNTPLTAQNESSAFVSASQTTSNDLKQHQTTSNDLKQHQTTSNDISFSPIDLNPSRHFTPAFRHRTANDSAHKWLRRYAPSPGG